MAKEITCKELKVYFEFDEKDDMCTRLCELKWNGREPKGYDIRKYSKADEKYYKGINISYEAMTDFILSCVENGLCDIKEIKEAIKKRENSIVSNSDLDSMFSAMNKEITKYHRDKYGDLRDDNGSYVVSRRKKEKK